MHVLVENQQRGLWQAYRDPIHIITAQNLEQVLPALQTVQAAVEKEGLFAAGFITYEAAPAFDAAYKTLPQGSLPLLQFGLYRRFYDLATLPKTSGDASTWQNAEKWQADISEASYEESFSRIKDHLRLGETYQVNYSFRLRKKNFAPGAATFADLVCAQGKGCAALVETAHFDLLSVSPELFFMLHGDEILTKPMKGTRKRGRWLEEDKKIAAELTLSTKERAENLMIVDMMRNDLGRIAYPSSIQVPALFTAERYPTIQQMTSTVRARTGASFVEIMKALFPCASITGAPKVKTMEIIAHEETAPRGIYTGTIGFYHPGREALFNVAIRTLSVDKINHASEYGVGGGIVWDSNPVSEYQECLTKSRVLHQKSPPFRLLETLLWTKEDEFFLEKRHIQRMQDSADYFGFTFNPQHCQETLATVTATLHNEGVTQPQKVRLLGDHLGKFQWESASLKDDFFPASNPIMAQAKPPLTAALAQEAVNSQDPFLFHKTTHRQIYEQQKRASYDTTLLYNQREELTECMYANVVLRYGEVLLTPARSCGLLAGTYRQELLESGEIQEAILTLQDLNNADDVFQINSVGLWTRLAVLVQDLHTKDSCSL
jgi:para-aminobenzoate synthetase/4-amino-4-deoxychorismate lyase